MSNIGVKPSVVPASPQVAQQLILEVLASGPMKRSELIEQIRRIAPRSGFVLEAGSAIATTKKALKVLLEEGRIATPRIGWWALPSNGGTNIEDAEEINDTADDDTDDEDESGVISDEEQLRPGTLTIRKQIGEGPECVYVYYHEVHAELARRDGRVAWECKVGWTVGEPNVRIIGQGAMTCFPRPPVIGLAIKTHSGRHLERLLHSALKFAGKSVEDGGGTEWFMTSPERVESWYEAYLKTLEILTGE